MNNYNETMLDKQKNGLRSSSDSYNSGDLSLINLISYYQYEYVIYLRVVTLSQITCIEE